MNNSHIKKSVTFASTLEDIAMLKKLGSISFPVAISTTVLISDAEKMYNKGKHDQANKLIDAAIVLIEKTPKILINPTAKDILLYDFAALKKLIK